MSLEKQQRNQLDILLADKMKDIRYVVFNQKVIRVMGWSQIVTERCAPNDTEEVKKYYYEIPDLPHLGVIEGKWFMTRQAAIDDYVENINKQIEYHIDKIVELREKMAIKN